MADKRLKHKSKYTLDRGMPGAFEGETITRRRFMTGSAHTALAPFWSTRLGLSEAELHEDLAMVVPQAPPSEARADTVQAILAAEQSGRPATAGASLFQMDWLDA